MTTSPVSATRLLRRAVRRTPWIAGALLVAGGLGGGVAYAYWQSTDSSNDAAARADSLPAGATPVAAVTGPSQITVSFDRVATAGGRNVTSYLVRRYDSATATTPVASFTCSGSGTTVSCADSGVPGGTWYYTDTPQLASWSGTESARSGAASTDSTAPSVSVTSVSPAPNGNGYNSTSPVTVSLSAADEAGGSGVASITYWVDSGAHSVVAASSASVPVSGDGDHTVNFFATDAAGNSSAPQTQTVRIDTTAPVLSGLTVPAWVNLAGRAAVPVSGGVTEANTSTVTVVATDHNAATVTKTVAIAAGASSWSTTLDLTSLADGSVGWTAVAKDVAGNDSAVLTGSSVKDTVAPDMPTSVAIANGGGAGSAYINLANVSSVNYAVTIPAGAANSATDTISVTLTSGATITATRASSNPGGSVTLAGINTSSLADGTVGLQATATDQAGNTSGIRTGSTPKDTAAPTSTLSGSDKKYNYTDNTGTTADQVSGDSGAVSLVAGDGTLTLTATEQTGPHPGNVYQGPTVNGNGSFPAFSVDASTVTVSYTFRLYDLAGNPGNTITKTFPATK
jgi:hypothetical protein